MLQMMKHPEEAFIATAPAYRPEGREALGICERRCKVQDASDGMPRECAISLDNLRTVPKALLVEPITELGADKRGEVCRALETASGCH